MSKPLPILSHMPWNVKQQIVNSTNTMTKQSLRLVSKDYKNLVTRSPVYYDGVYLVFTNRKQKCTIILKIDEDHVLQVVFRKIENGYKIRKIPEEREGTIKSGDFFEAIANYLTKIFRNPQAHFRFFFIAIRDSHFPIATYNAIKESILKPLHRVVSSLGHLIAVEDLHMTFSPTNEEIHDLLSCFRPGALKNIIVEAEKDYLEALPQSQTDLSDVVELEQWKQATKFCGQSIQIRVPVEKWSHFSFLEIEAPELTFNEAKQLIQAVMHSDHNCLGTVVFRSDISQQLIDHFSPMGLPFEMPYGKIFIPLHAPNTHLLLIIRSEHLKFIR